MASWKPNGPLLGASWRLLGCHLGGLGASWAPGVAVLEPSCWEAVIDLAFWPFWRSGQPGGTSNLASELAPIWRGPFWRESGLSGDRPVLATELVPSWYQLVPAGIQLVPSWCPAGTSWCPAGTSWYQLVPSVRQIGHLARTVAQRNFQPQGFPPDRPDSRQIGPARLAPSWRQIGRSARTGKSARLTPPERRQIDNSLPAWDPCLFQHPMFAA